jgi:pyrroloquinoline quinone (PQQ) biosynthesis protein C
VPTVVFGGKNLGFQGGRFEVLNSGGTMRPHNDMWLTVAAALGVSVEQLQGEAILKGKNTGIINQIWKAPA